MRSIVLLCLLLFGCQDKSIAPAPAPSVASAPLTVASAAPTNSTTVAPVKPPRTITISAVGDCTFGGGIENGIDATPFDQMMAKHKDDFAYPFSAVLDIFRHDDITIVNLEGTLTTSTETIPEGKFHFRGKPDYARILQESSVEVANIANNHIGDFGVRGLEDTRRALQNAGVGISGNGLVDRRTVQGIDVVNLGFTGIHMTHSQVKTAIGEAKTPQSLVIASFHWGVEGTHEVIDIQREYGRLAIDAGADLVLGHHPHVVQALETYQGKHIVHSLGNFVFGANTNPQKNESMIYRATFVEEDGRVVRQSFEVIPVLLCSRLPCPEFRPVPLEGEPKQKFLTWLASENEKLEKRPYPTPRH